MGVLSSSKTCFAPTKPHFFQPCLPGFTRQLNIPVVFFKNHLLGYKSQDLTLRSGLSDKSWKVKISRGKLTTGWKEFLAAHGVQLGDVVVFRLEGNTVFYVTVFDSTACERDYPPYVCVEKEDRSGDSAEHLENHDNTSFKADLTDYGLKRDRVNVPKVFAETNGLARRGCNVIIKDSEEKSVTKTEASSSRVESSSFAVTVRDYNIRKCYMCLPNKFVKMNGLEHKAGEIELMDGDGRICSAKLNKTNTPERYFIGRGWGAFCSQNRLKKGDSLKIEIIRLGSKPILKISNGS